jgi:group I intron endonuclease
MLIYKTTNLINGKIYIGRDSKDNSSYIGSGCQFKKAIKQFGKENFKKEIIERCANYDTLCKREEYWIEFFNATNTEIGYNRAKKTGKNFMFGLRQTDEHKRKISLANTGKINSKEHRKKISLATKGKPKHDQLFKNKQRTRNLGNNNPMFGKTVYDVWVEKYGKEEADKKQQHLIEAHSKSTPKGEKHPMHNGGLYKIWFTKYGKEEAEKRKLEWANKLQSPQQGLKNCNATKYIIRTPTNEIVEILTSKEITRVLGLKQNAINKLVRGEEYKNYKLLEKVRLKDHDKV